MHNIPHTEETKDKCSVATKRLWESGHFNNRPPHSEYTRIKIRNTLRIGVYGKCVFCGKEIYSSPSRVKKYCSRLCSGKAHSGKNSPVYNGYSGKYPSKHLRTSEYKNWRKAVFTRDDYTCQDCGDKGVFLHPHHILSYTKFKEFRHDVDNGITLCVPCHRNRHKRKR